MNQKLLERLKPEQVEVDIVRVEEPEASGVEESELDEMWSYVGKKMNPTRWLWHAIDRRTGQVKRVCVWSPQGQGISSTETAT